ncbi:MAG TPA: GspH/FimT family pseudopilin [Burkholderiales bacterium]|nr:GspH/FimT family pseudopilin [Burkholderiales bacterium]
MKNYQAGFNLIELMIGVAILGMVGAFALPSFTNSIKDNRIRTVSSDVLADLAFARSQAATLGTQVAVCISSNGTSCAVSGSNWGVGRLVYVDADESGTFNAGDTILRVRDSLSGTATLSATGGAWGGTTYVIRYRPSGVPVSSVGNLDICDDRPGITTGRRITLSNVGRASSASYTCP